MRKALISAALGLSVVAGSLAISAPANAFTLVNYQSLYTGQPKCLGLRAGTPTDGTRFVVWSCDQSANQSFSTSIYPDYSVTNPTVGVTTPLWDQAAYRKGVSVNGNSKSNNAEVILWSEYTTSSPGQFWTPDSLNSPAPGCYRFINPNSGKVMGTWGGSTANGTAVIIYTDYKDPANHPDQYWCVR